MTLIVGVGLAVGLVATAIALGEGLRVDTALGLISDPDTSPLVASPGWIAASITLNELTVLALMVLWRRRLQVPLRAVLPTAPVSRRALMGAVLLPFGFAPLAEVASEFVYRTLPPGVTPNNVVPVLARGTGPVEFVGILIAAAALPAVVEEAMFRGFVTTAFRRYSPPVVLAIPSLMFGLFHLEPTQAAGTVVLGAAFGLVRLYTGSIWACIASHFAYNAGVLLETRWLNLVVEHRIVWGEVGIGLVVAVVAYALLLGDLGKQYLSRLSFRPPPRGQP